MKRFDIMSGDDVLLSLQSSARCQVGNAAGPRQDRTTTMASSVFIFYEILSSVGPIALHKPHCFAGVHSCVHVRNGACAGG